jgi:hypothetical protein
MNSCQGRRDTWSPTITSSIGFLPTGWKNPSNRRQVPEKGLPKLGVTSFLHRSLLEGTEKSTAFRAGDPANSRPRLSTIPNFRGTFVLQKSRWDRHLVGWVASPTGRFHFVAHGGSRISKLDKADGCPRATSAEKDVASRKHIRRHQCYRPGRFEKGP